jgi:hypothetical protein
LAARACGPAARLEDGVCRSRACAPEMIFDEASETCIPLASVRQIATAALFSLDSEERVGCPEDATLRVAHGKARCAAANACARGQFSANEDADAKADASADRSADASADASADRGADAGASARATAGPSADGGARACLDPAPCPPGWLASPVAPHACETFVTASGSIDAASWLRLTIGSDGSSGTRWVCEALDALSARLFDLRGATMPVYVQLDIPANDVTEVALTLRVDGPREATPLVEKSLQPLAEAFRSLGGTATTTQASVRVTCNVPQSPRPIRTRPRGERDGGM